MLSLTLRRHGLKSKPISQLIKPSIWTFSSVHRVPHTFEEKKAYIKEELAHRAVKEMEKNEKGFHDYCKSIGIPSKESRNLAIFLNRTYNSLPRGNLTSDQIKQYILYSLESFKSMPNNRWGTNRVSELKRILTEKEKRTSFYEYCQTKTR